MDTFKFLGGAFLLWLIVVAVISWNKPLKAQAVAYEMRGLLTPHSFYTEDGVQWWEWKLGAEYSINSATPIIIRHMKDMQGKTVKITIEVIEETKR